MCGLPYRLHLKANAGSRRAGRTLSGGWERLWTWLVPRRMAAADVWPLTARLPRTPAMHLRVQLASE